MLEKVAFWATCGAVVMPVVSIAACQILLGVALAALFLQRRKLDLPVYWVPLALFFAGTVIAALASEAPLAAMPQFKKFFVFTVVLCVANTIRTASQVRNILLAIVGASALSSIWSLVQYWRKWDAADEQGLDFKLSYIASRITGFMSHWMTFSGEIMIALLVLVAFAMFGILAADPKKEDSAPFPRHPFLYIVPIGLLLATALVLAQTRAMWIGCAFALIYLVWHWNKRMLLALPFLASGVFFVSPEQVQERVVSLVRPRGELDSNAHRKACWAIGWEIVKAHPLLGLGPEMVKRHYQEYVPQWLSKKLPEGYYQHLHNIYFQYAAERGVPVLLLFLWMIGWIVRDCWRALLPLAPGPSDERFIFHSILAITMSVMIAGFVENNLGDSEVLQLFLGVSQCGYAAIRKS